MDDREAHYLFLGEEGTGKTTAIKILSLKATRDINDFECYQVSFKGQEMCLIDAKTIHEYKNHNPNSCEIDIAVLVLSPERLQKPFIETEMQLNETFGGHFKDKFIFLILCETQSSVDAATLSNEVENLICNADKPFHRIFKQYCCTPVTLQLPRSGFLETNELFENVIEMNSEMKGKSKQNDKAIVNVLVVRDGTEASLVRDMALTLNSRTERVNSYTKGKSTFIDTPPLEELLANKELFKDAFSKQINVIILLIKESRMPLPTLFPKLEDALGHAFYDHLSIGINLFGKDSTKYNSIKDNVTAMMKSFVRDPKVFPMPALSTSSRKVDLLSNIAEIPKHSEGKPSIENRKRKFVLLPGRNDYAPPDDVPKESRLKEILQGAVCVDIGDTKLLEIDENGYCIMFLETPLIDKSDLNKYFLQLCKDGVHLIIVDKANENKISEYLETLFPKNVHNYIFKCELDPSHNLQENNIAKAKIVDRLESLSSPIKMEDCHVLFIGENGSGKSSSINTIVGKSVFETGHIWSSKETITQDVQRYTYVNENYKVAFGRNITLIDTPNIKKIKKNKVSKSGIDVVVLVVKIDRLTPYRLNFFEKVPELFTERVFRHMLILFTFAENLSDENINSFLASGGQEISEFMKKINERHVTFNNTSRDPTCEQKAREQFFEKLSEILKSNQGKVLSTMS